MRTVFLDPLDDAMLRQLAHDLHVTKSELMAAAVGEKIALWSDPANRELALREIAGGTAGR